MAPDTHSYGWLGSLFGASVGFVVAQLLSWPLYITPFLMWGFAAFFGQLLPARRAAVIDPEDLTSLVRSGGVALVGCPSCAAGGLGSEAAEPCSRCDGAGLI